MVLQDLFEKTSSDWVRFSKYEILEKDGVEWITPAADSELLPYNPVEIAEQLVLDALNTGRMIYEQQLEEPKKREILMAFVQNYGLLGLMTNFPLIGGYMDGGRVLLGPNPFFDTDVMETKDYIWYFQPFGVKEGQPKTDKLPLPIALMSGKDLEFSIVFSRNYSERMDWVMAFFKEFFINFAQCKMYALTDNPAEKRSFEQDISGFTVRGLNFHLEMDKKPTMVWDFNSLKMAIETIYAVSITRADAALRMCKHCGAAFYATHGRSEFCSDRCRNQYNVYKFREREKEKETKKAAGKN